MPACPVGNHWGYGPDYWCTGCMDLEKPLAGDHGSHGCHVYMGGEAKISNIIAPSMANRGHAGAEPLIWAKGRGKNKCTHLACL